MCVCQRKCLYVRVCVLPHNNWKIYKLRKIIFQILVKHFLCIGRRPTCLGPLLRPKLLDDLTELTDGRFVAVAADGNVEGDVTGCCHGSNEFVVD